jgi:hypothetical protein
VVGGLTAVVVTPVVVLAVEAAVPVGPLAVAFVLTAVAAAVGVVAAAAVAATAVVAVAAAAVVAAAVAAVAATAVVAVAAAAVVAAAVAAVVVEAGAVATLYLDLRAPQWSPIYSLLHQCTTHPLQVAHSG